jgi:septum formation protein
MREAGFTFEVRVKDTQEDYPAHMAANEVPGLLALRKAEAFKAEIGYQQVVLTADTIVVVNNTILNKPASREEAYQMIRSLSGHSHSVYTGVCLMSLHKTIIFTEETRVHFTELSDEEIYFYIDTCQPFDKAGAYGIQEWIGLIGIERLEGSYFNVVGLPVHRVYKELKLSFGL